MNKHLYNLTLGLAAAAAMSLASCADDVAAPGVPGQDGEGVWMSIDVSRGSDPASRLTHTEDANGLNVAWEQDDYIYVFDLNSERLIGKLDYVKTVTDDSEGCTASFAGQLTSAPTGTVSIFYAGKDANGTRRIITEGQDLEISYASQAGSFDAMAYNDVMTNPSVSVTVNNGQATSANTVEMSHACAFAHFKTDLDANTVVTVNVPQSYTTYKIKANGGFAPSSRAADFTATVQDGGDLYIAMLLVNGKPEITFTAGGKTVTLPAPSVALAAGNYYRAGWTTEGGSEGIEVKFNSDPAPAVDHSKNPLLYWATSDLVNVQNGNNAYATFASSPYVQGSYYQFGRNKGFTSLNDAMTEFYCDVNSNLTSNYGTAPFRGDANGNVTCYDPTLSLAGYPNAFLVENKYGDYLSPRKGQNWYDRATTNGYSRTSPCPDDKWCIPSKADWAEILPTENVVQDNMWVSGNEYTEVKEANGVNCAFRYSGWYDDDYNCYFMRIECLVVSSEVTTVSNDSEIWSDSNVKHLDFRASGRLMSFTKQLSSYPSVSIARPVYWSTQYTSYIEGNYVYCTQAGDSRMNEGGFYWSSDKDQSMMAFVFNHTNYTTLDTSLGLRNTTNSSAANIRCILKEEYRNQ